VLLAAVMPRSPASWSTPGKDAGSPDADRIGASEDAERRRLRGGGERSHHSRKEH